MYRFNLKEACLLDVSGELSSAARKELFAYISQNPAARLEYESIRRRFETLQSIPFPEPSAFQRAAIPANIKASIRRTLKLQKTAGQHPVRRHWAFSGAAAVAAGIIVTVLVGVGMRVIQNRQRTLAANAMIDRVTSLSNQPPTAYEQAVTAVDASLLQLQTGSPTLANVQDTNMSALLDALVSMPQDPDDFSPDGPYGPSGSF